MRVYVDKTRNGWRIQFNFISDDEFDQVKEWTDTNLKHSWIGIPADSQSLTVITDDEQEATVCMWRWQ